MPEGADDGRVRIVTPGSPGGADADRVGARRITDHAIANEETR
jgi:hypothetical protein